MKKWMLSTIVFGLFVANAFRVELAAQQTADDSQPEETANQGPDRRARSAITIRLYKLRQAKAADAVAALRKLLDADETNDSDRGELRIAADDRINAVIGRGSEETLNKIERLLRQIDQPDDPARGQPKDAETAIKVFQLKYIDAQLAEEIARELYADAKHVTIVADARTNSVIVSSSRQVIENVDKLFRVLDSNKKLVQIHMVDGVMLFRGERNDVRNLQQLLAQAIKPAAQTAKPESRNAAPKSGEDDKAESNNRDANSSGSPVEDESTPQEEVGGMYARHPNNRSLDLVAMTDSLSAAMAARRLAKHDFLRCKQLHERQAATDSQLETLKIKLESVEQKIALLQQLLVVAIKGAEHEVASLAEQKKLLTAKLQSGRVAAFEVLEIDRRLNAAETYMRLLREIYDNSQARNADP